MIESLQQRRRIDRAKDHAAGIVVSMVLALVLAGAIEGGLLAISMALGDPNWHRAWVEARLKESMDWLEQAPLVGAVAAPLVDPQRGWLPGPGAWRDILTLGLLLVAPCYWAGARIGPTLIARFDDEALRHAPPAQVGLQWAGPLGTAQQTAWAALTTWCKAGVGTGRAPFWRPWALPEVAERFSIAVMVGENGGGKSHLAEAFARELDRDDELAALAARSRVKAWGLKLTTKWNELWWWRGRHPQQPWDCGYLVEDPAALNKLAQFRPRRPTLLIADEPRAQSLDQALRWLSAARVDFRHPVRLLIIDVVLPSTLALRFDADREDWSARAYELGKVKVVSLGQARFQAAQFRALVGAQPPEAGRKPTRLMGRDDEWTPVTAALDEQPILLAEAIRWVRDGARGYDDLLAASEPPHLADLMSTRQAQRSTPVLEPDTLGKRRELLRERVLRDRAGHRQEGLCQALAADTGSVAYHALMVATAAGGGSASRLQSLLASAVNPLTPQHLNSAFGQPLSSDWVPPIKPAIVADELLRMHVGALTNMPLAGPQRERVRDLMRQAWLLNPGGARQTVARWQARRLPDAFTQAMCTLPTLVDLQVSLDSGLRVELARAFTELAVFSAGGLAEARQALALLQPAERAAALDKLLAVLLHPDAGGVPALVLWLDLQRLNFPLGAALNPAQSEEGMVRLATEALQLLLQCGVVSVPVDATLEAALDEAAFAALPLVPELANGVAASASIAKIAQEIDQRVIGAIEQGALGQANRLRHRLRLSLLAALVRTRDTDAARQGWAPWVLSAIGQLDGHSVAPSLDEILVESSEDATATAEPGGLPVIALARAIALWSRCHSDSAPSTAEAVRRMSCLSKGYEDEAAVQEATAIAWSSLAHAHKDTDAQATAKAVQKVAEIAARFERHEGIQHEAAKAWCRLSCAHEDTDSQATAQAAQKVAEIAARFERHDGIQHEAAQAWRHLSCALENTDAQATAQAAQKVAEIASRFERHDGIQLEAAQAWRHLSWAHHDTDAQATAQAAQKVAEIAARFERHDGIQRVAAQAWRNLSWAHKDTDTRATAQAVRKVVEIAARFEWHEVIQHEAAQAWRILAFAHKDTDTRATAQAVRKVVEIAARFERHEGIQQAAAEAWCTLAFAYKDTDAQATAQAAQKVAEIAARFKRHEVIEREAARAWCFLSWAHKDTDAQATALAVQKVAEIAARFERHESFQFEAAQAWRLLSWAHRDTDAQATAQAAQRVAEIAARFGRHEGIQLEAATAWHNLSWAHRDTDAQAAAHAAQKVAEIAGRFERHEGVQFVAAKAWRFTTLAAVKFDDESLVDVASRALDKLAGVDSNGFRASIGLAPGHGQILQQRELARVAVDAWRANRRPRS